MTNPNRDPLLAAARIIVNIAMGLCALVGGAVALAVPLILFNQQRVIIEVARQGAPQEVLGAVLLLLVLVALCAALGFVFFRELRRIVDTVRAGDPFVEENAGRLRTMGWLTLAVQLVTIPIGALGLYLDSVSDKVHSDIGISPGGILLTLTLFILARVFRHGAAMRQDLEGTV